MLKAIFSSNLRARITFVQALIKCISTVIFLGSLIALPQQQHNYPGRNQAFIYYFYLLCFLLFFEFFLDPFEELRDYPYSSSLDRSSSNDFLQVVLELDLFLYFFSFEVEFFLDFILKQFSLSIICISQQQFINLNIISQDVLIRSTVFQFIKLFLSLKSFAHVGFVYQQQMRRICLFDIDGTLTKSRNKINQQMKDCLSKLKNFVDIGFVGGSDQKKIRQQLDEDSIALSNYFFSQNGLIAYKGKQLLGKQAIKDFLGEEKLKNFINFCLHYIADLDIPIKRGTFIQYRTGLINVSPIGRNCSQEERDQFEAYDAKVKVRENFIKSLQSKFPDYGLKYSIGGQISFDVFPIGWDKTYCLKYLKEYDEIFFFGDKTDIGGNDHQIYELMKKQNRGFSVKQGPQKTIQILSQLFFK